jgi:hypothetical protein
MVAGDQYGDTGLQRLVDHLKGAVVGGEVAQAAVAVDEQAGRCLLDGRHLGLSVELPVPQQACVGGELAGAVADNAAQVVGGQQTGEQIRPVRRQAGGSTESAAEALEVCGGHPEVGLRRDVHRWVSSAFGTVEVLQTAWAGGGFRGC